jgi:hypothetical protein
MADSHNPIPSPLGAEDCLQPAERRPSIGELLACPEAAEIDIEFPRVNLLPEPITFD